MKTKIISTILAITLLFETTPIIYAGSPVEEATCRATAMQKYKQELSCDALKKRDQSEAKAEAQKKKAEADKAKAAEKSAAANKAADEKCRKDSFAKEGMEMNCEELGKYMKAKLAEETATTSDEKCRADTLAKEGMEMSCAEYEKYKGAKSAEEKAIKDAEAKKAEEEKERLEAEEACKKASKEIDGVERDCAGYYAKVEDDRQIECKKPTREVPEGFKDCAEKEAAMKNRQGAGFKLNLNSLTVKSGKDKQRSGSAIFENKDYAQHGVIVGTLLRVIDILIMLIGSLAMLTLVIAGIFMITNHGDEAWVTKGKTMMLYSILGILFALLSFVFVQIIQTALA